MLNINVFRLVVYKKNILKVFCDINLHTTMTLKGVTICDPRDFMCINLNLLVLRMIHAKYQCIQASGS